MLFFSVQQLKSTQENPEISEKLHRKLVKIRRPFGYSDLRKYLPVYERRTMILHKLLEGGCWATEQAGNYIRDGCCRTCGKIGQQVTHRLDVPIGHSRFAHSVRCCRDWYVHVLNFPAEHGRQLFGNLLKGQGFRPGDDITFPFVTGTREYLSCDRADVADVHRALRRVLKRPIEHALHLDRVGE